MLPSPVLMVGVLLECNHAVARFRWLIKSATHKVTFKLEVAESHKLRSQTLSRTFPQV